MAGSKTHNLIPEPGVMPGSNHYRHDERVTMTTITDLKNAPIAHDSGADFAAVLNGTPFASVDYSGKLKDGTSVFINYDSSSGRISIASTHGSQIGTIGRGRSQNFNLNGHELKVNIDSKGTLTIDGADLHTVKGAGASKC